MYKDPAETTFFFDSFRPLVERSGHCDIVICPSFLDVENAVAAVHGTRNLYWADQAHLQARSPASICDDTNQPADKRHYRVRSFRRSFRSK
ncbi:MAG: hypothetical protein ABSB35_39375 [Bryobacteraceae bacterium]